MNRFNVLNLREGVLDKKMLALMKVKVQPVVSEMLRYTVDWLRERRYPLRHGSLPESQASRVEWNGQTPTQRLHPGEKPLWAAMNSQLRKAYRQSALAITLYNTSEHAPLFFSQIKRHYIAATDEQPLIFHAGAPLPWNPPFDGKKPGIRKMRAGVKHPGHLPYGEMLQDSLDYYFGQDLDRAVSNAAEEGRDTLGE